MFPQLESLVPLVRGIRRHIPGPLATMTVLVLLAGLGQCLQANVIISYQVTNLGTSNGSQLYRYSYSFTDLGLLANQELDLQFDAAKYGSLSNGFAGADFDLLLFQPDSPPGANGDYSALALVDNPSPLGRFSVDFAYLGTGIPGAQPFVLYDDSGPVSTVIGSGLTTPLNVSSAPEPPGFTLGGLGSLVCLAGLTLGRRRSKQ
jgi:hypothetical protein